MDSTKSTETLQKDKRIEELEKRIELLEKKLIRFGVLDNPNGVDDVNKENKPTFNKFHKIGMMVAGAAALITVPMALLLRNKRKK